MKNLFNLFENKKEKELYERIDKLERQNSKLLAEIEEMKSDIVVNAETSYETRQEHDNLRDEFDSFHYDYENESFVTEDTIDNVLQETKDDIIYEVGCEQKEITDEIESRIENLESVIKVEETTKIVNQLREEIREQLLSDKDFIDTIKDSIKEQLLNKFMKGL